MSAATTAIKADMYGRGIPDLFCGLRLPGGPLTKDDVCVFLAAIARTTGAVFPYSIQTRSLEDWCLQYAPERTVSSVVLQEMRACLLQDYGRVVYFLVPWNEAQSRCVVKLQILDPQNARLGELRLDTYLEELESKGLRLDQIVLLFVRVATDLILAAPPEHGRESFNVLAGIDRQLRQIFRDKGLSP